MNRLFTALVAAAALSVASCSSHGPTIAPPPPTGKYSNSSLNGNYAFVTSGEAITSGATAATPFSRTGSFTANGSGTITGGVYDLVNAGGTSTATGPIPITGGSYSVSANGRGTMTFNITSNGAPATLTFAIVLTSTSDGLMMDETASGSQASTGSGNFILQNPATFAVGGSYVFDFTGLDGNSAGPFPESLVGQFAASGGVITSGTEDANDDMALTSSGSITGSFTLDSANTAAGRGIAIIESQAYAFYIVDSTRVRFISINSGGVGPMLTGDAVLQTNSVPPPATALSTSFVFLVSGSSANGGLTRVGRLSSNGSTLSNMVMDVNNGGSENEFGSGSLSNGSITYDATTGRGTLSFQSSSVNVYSFIFYLSSPSSGVIQEVSGPNASTATVVADGSLLAQSGTFSSSTITGPYAMNWSGLVTSAGSLGSQDEEDLLAQANISNLGLSGTSDIFQFTGVTLNMGVGTAGQITLNGDGTANNTMTVSLSQVTPIDMVVYLVNPQLVFFANRDNNGATRIVAGILRAQQ
ncbi:MAG: hypothetical protein DMG40_10380 [Acidobacteria bacterium]|nr:MAG: hypothetical protein DMG40_10380 [Acidobacteriota bacterium]